MAKKEVKTYSLTEMKDLYIGKVGTADRDEYEYELSMDVLGKMINSSRIERQLTHEDWVNSLVCRKLKFRNSKAVRSLTRTSLFIHLFNVIIVFPNNITCQSRFSLTNVLVLQFLN
jgi:hypothetical protein